MNYAEFSRRFTEDKEIARDITDDEVVVYCDNGSDVGTWRQDRRTTCGKGEALSHADAEMARYWFRAQADALSLNNLRYPARAPMLEYYSRKAGQQHTISPLRLLLPAERPPRDVTHLDSLCLRKSSRHAKIRADKVNHAARGKDAVGWGR